MCSVVWMVVKVAYRDADCSRAPSASPALSPSQIFHFIDADHDGEISMHDLTVAMQHTGLDWEQQGIMRLLAGLDLARDGTVGGSE